MKRRKIAGGGGAGGGSGILYSQQEGSSASMLTLEEQCFHDILSSMNHPPPLKPLPTKFRSWKDYSAGFAPMVLEEIAAIAEQPEEDQYSACDVTDVETCGPLMRLRVKLGRSTGTLNSSQGGKSLGLMKHSLLELAPRPDPRANSGNVRAICSSILESNAKSTIVMLLVQRMDWTSFARHLGPPTSSHSPLPRLFSRVLCNLVTSAREYMAISSLKNSKLLPSLLSAKQTTISGSNLQPLPAGFVENLRRTFNPSQFDAVMNVVGPEAFTLVQGPPGTGKTTTLLGIINSLHLSGYNSFYDSALVVSSEGSEPAIAKPSPFLQWLLTTDQDTFMRRPRTLQDALMHVEESAIKLKPRLLVCAPSNAATDSIALKVIQSGFMDGTGNRYNPPIVRIGRSTSTPVIQAGIDLPSALGRWMDSPPHQIEQLLKESEARVAALEQEFQRFKHASLARLHEIMGASFSKTGDKDHAGALPAAEFSTSDDDADVILGEDSEEEEMREKQRSQQQAEKAQARRERLRAERKGVGAARTEAVRARCGEFLSTTDQNLSIIRGHIVRALEAYVNEKAHLRKLHIMRNLVEKKGDPSFLRVRAQSQEAMSNALLEDAQVVFTTLSSSALGSIENFVEHIGAQFETVVVDEAAQSVELSAIIPMRYGCKKCILVGDPKQLPATVLSRRAASLGYSRSLFARLMEGGHPHHLLNIQYRSHPMIYRFPSDYFYGGKVVDDPSLVVGRRQEFHSAPSFRPVVFFDVKPGSEKVGAAGHSYANPEEARFVVSLVIAIRKWRGNRNGQPIKFTGSIGVLSPYRAQIKEIQDQLERWQAEEHRRHLASAKQQQHSPEGSGRDLPLNIMENLEINTVDSFQGQERDIIILSTVRAQDVVGKSAVSKGSAKHTFDADAAEESSAIDQDSALAELAEVEEGEIVDDDPQDPFTSTEKKPDPFKKASPFVSKEGGFAGLSRKSSGGGRGHSKESKAAEQRVLPDKRKLKGSGGPVKPEHRVSVAPSIGFLADTRRMNVALTRAKYGLWVVGHSASLSYSRPWQAFLTYVHDANLILPVADTSQVPGLK